MADMMREPPLVVDVDGTLIKTDLLHEKVMLLATQDPLALWRLPVWLAGGKQRLKCELAARVPVDVDTIPLRDETMARIRAAQARGRPVYLASASEQGVVERLAARIGGIAGVFGTKASVNVAGHRKAEALNAVLGAGGYDYIGDRRVDFPIWRSARKVLAVSHSDGFSRSVERNFPGAEIVARSRRTAGAYVAALRVHQWAKNILVFLPLIAGHHFGPSAVIAALLAFVCFCFAASSAYVINDLLDLAADRAHPRKRHRPFAAGDIPISYGVVLAAALMLAAIGVGSALPSRFFVTLGGYVVCTLAYSLALKRQPLIDVILLGCLYTMRVLGGISATETYYSPWLLMFCLFLFLSLAVVKRCSELIARRGEGQAPSGRGYVVQDLAVLFPLAAAAGYGAVLVVALYLSSEKVRALYTHPARLWLICPLLLYWVSRVLMLCNRNQMHDDPVVFALTDRTSWFTGALLVAVVAVSM